MLAGVSKRCGAPIRRFTSQPPASACRVAAAGIRSRIAGRRASAPTASAASHCTHSEPTKMPGHSRQPKIITADSAMPAGGNTGAA